MKVTLIGSGDAFGSGGRFQTCFDVQTAGARFFIDYGASAPVACAKAGIRLNDIDAIFISHLHGDHFGGLPFAILDCSHISKRTTPLTIFGPPTIEARYTALAEAMFPEMTSKARNFDLIFREMNEGTATSWAGLSVSAFSVEHPSGAPSHALRFSSGDKVLAFSGDTGWCENVVTAGQNADLFLLECYSHANQNIPYHMNWPTISSHLPRINARQVVLTHMSKNMLAHCHDIDQPGVAISHDGMVIEI